jgi:hypothetical protein
MSETALRLPQFEHEHQHPIAAFQNETNDPVCGRNFQLQQHQTSFRFRAQRSGARAQRSGARARITPQTLEKYTTMVFQFKPFVFDP